MKTFKDFEFGKHYKRNNTEQIFFCWGEYLYPYPKIYSAYLIKEHNPANFTQVVIKERFIKNKRNGEVAKVRKDGDIHVEDLMPFIKSNNEDSKYYCSPDDFYKFVNGDYKNDFEFVTEVKVIEEIPHISKVDKCDTCVHEYEKKDQPNLKLAIIGIETDEQRKAVQEKAFSLGCKWVGDTEFNYYDKLQFSSIWVGFKEANYMVYDLQNYETEQIKDIQENFPEAKIVTVNTFLNNY